MARLEWAYQEVLTAADAVPLDLRQLAAVAPQDYDEIVFVLHPALRTVTSAAPVLAIWRANQPGVAENAEIVDLDSGPSRVLLSRQRDHVELRECPSGLFALIRALANRRSLGAAANLATRADASFDLTAGLQRLAALGALVDFHPSNAAPVTLEAP